VETLQGLTSGFAVALTPANLFYAFLGVLFGTLIGVLPGIGPVAGIGLLIPVTFEMGPVSAMIMLAGIFYGSMYGGSTTSILIKMPGEAASVIAAIEGHAMAKQGRAGPALAIAAIGSFVAGTLSVLGLMLLAPALVKVALRFGPHEYFSLMILGLTMVSYLGGRSLPKALAMAALGLIFSTVGQDPVTGARRFTFGRIELIDGVGFVPAVIGLFAIGEILYNLRHPAAAEVICPSFRSLWPTREDLARSAPPIVRGSIIGFLLGVLPGAGTVISTFVSYAVERRLSKHPERFGHGAIEGLAGPEAANNGATGGALVPLMSLGLPSSPVTAVMMGALIVHGLLPGPQLMERRPEVFWGLVASMYIGNVMLLVLNLPLAGLWASVLRVPQRTLWPLILLLTLVGAYTVESRAGDLLVAAAFGALGYAMRELDFPLAPVVLGLVLGPLLEGSFRQALVLSHGSFVDFLVRPISAGLLLVSVVLIGGPPAMRIVGKRQRPLLEAMSQDD
jgi:putative tricarboxylic transport membrane protein